jgi:hypothetical protein
MISEVMEQRIGVEIVRALKKTPFWGIITDIAYEEHSRGYDHGIKIGRALQRELHRKRGQKKAKK